MQNFLIVLIIVIPIFSFAQTDQPLKGIRFETELNWSQIKEKAKRENKYIFVDCYATWCVPCHRMDKEIYSLETVGDYVNENYVSVKIQMDSTKEDNKLIQSWRPVADKLSKSYNINSFPSYLFFSPEGKVVHKYIGFQPDSNFLKIARYATIESKQYYTLLTAYQAGVRNFAEIRYLAMLAKSIGEVETGNMLAKDYIENYLNVKEPKDFTSQELLLVRTYLDLVTPEDKIFKWIYKNQSKSDGLIGDQGFSNTIVEKMISKQYFTVVQNSSGESMEPDWSKLNERISTTYDKETAYKVVLNQKIKWFSKEKDWPNLIKYTIHKIDRFGLDTAGIGHALINNFIWEVVFFHSNDQEVLSKCIRYLEIIIQGHPDNLPAYDTYANLLYKSGNVKKAIEIERKVVFLEDENTAKTNNKPNPIYRQTVRKMEKGIPTWN